ncbi:disulfide bond formation protein B [Afifella pfennigii]|uniref:disulfide bond formation protein B n=1 Tax=Afifella pfennigii TaxID=209897 RepID=UPI00047E746F|nr:disulfide bond formation protein B [Afifella pfennigii]
MAALLRSPLALALIVFLASGATVLAALAFEHIGGYEPCALCLTERVPYYLALPVAAFAAGAAWRAAPPALLILVFAGLALIMAVSAGLGVYHAGVEWDFWEGPAACAPTGGPSDATSMLNSLQAGNVGPSCEDAVWRFLGLSFAGWNVVASLFLVTLALLGMVSARRR